MFDDDEPAMVTLAPLGEEQELTEEWDEQYRNDGLWEYAMMPGLGKYPPMWWRRRPKYSIPATEWEPTLPSEAEHATYPHHQRGDK